MPVQLPYRNLKGKYAPGMEPKHSLYYEIVQFLCLNCRGILIILYISCMDIVLGLYSDYIMCGRGMYNSCAILNTGAVRFHYNDCTIPIQGLYNRDCTVTM